MSAPNWRTRRSLVRAQELTEAMLAPIRAVADASKLPQTVWPSRFHGPDFYGVDCLLDSVAALLDTRPDCAAPEATHGLLTVLPAGYHTPAWRGEAA